MTDVAPTAGRGPRDPFAGVAVRDLVRDVVAVTALLVALALPWTVSYRGADRVEIVLVVLLAIAVVTLPYARRAGIFVWTWARDELRVRRIGLVPLGGVAAVYLVLDVIPGGSVGVGAGLGLALAGAVLAAALPGTRTLLVVAAVIGLGAVATPIVGLVEGGLAGWMVTARALTALFVLAVLWLTVWRFDRGDRAAGAALLAVGIVLALGAAVIGGASTTAWVESVHLARFGLLLLPAAAAAALPALSGQAPDEDAPRFWVRVAAHMLELGVLLGAYVALLAVIGIVTSAGFVEGALRLIFGVVVAVTLFLARRALVRDLAAGHATAVGAAVVVAVLGLVLAVVRADGSTAVPPVDVLLGLGVPAVVLGILFVPRSLCEAREAHQAEQVHESAQVAAQAHAQVVRPGTDAAGPHAEWSGAQQTAAAYPLQPSADQTAVLRPVTGVPPTVETARPAAAPAAQAGVHDGTRADVPADVPTGQGPFGAVGATQILAPVADVPGSRWTLAQAYDPATPLADLALIVQEAPHLRAAVAANPSTYPALLDWLGALGDPQVDAALRTRG